MIHLTNDAIQKKGEDYGKFEGGNKVRINIIRCLSERSISIWLKITKDLILWET